MMTKEGIIFFGGWFFGWFVLWASNKVHNYKPRRRTHHEEGLP